MKEVIISPPLRVFRDGQKFSSAPMNWRKKMTTLSKAQAIKEINDHLAKTDRELSANSCGRIVEDLNMLANTARYFTPNFEAVLKYARFTTIKKKEVIKPGLTVLRNATKRLTAPRIVPDCLKKYYS